MTVAELLRHMSSSEFREWCVYSGIEPFGEERADLRAGIIASTFASAYRKKGSRRPKPSDFMPKFGEQVERRQTWQEQLAIIERADIGFQKLFGEDADG